MTLIATDASSFRLLPLRFMRLPEMHAQDVLITSETGEYLFVSDLQLQALVDKQIPPEMPLYKDLLARHFIYEPGRHDPMPEMAAQYRSRKDFLFQGPALHIFVVTLRCNHTCQYCQVSRAPMAGAGHDLSEADARAAVDRVFESNAQALTVEFQGGEPLLAFERIQQIVEWVEARNLVEQRNVQFVVTTTLHHLTDEILDFAKHHQIQFSTSLDGPAALHNANRPTPSRDSYERTLEGVRRVREHMGHDAVSALTTLTARSLESPRAIIDEYVKQGFTSIALRPLSPYGFATRSAQRLDYPMERFVAFYKEALAYLLEINQQGVYLSESYTTLLLRNVLTPFASGYVDLRSPTGAGTGALVYNYDGYVYPSDEARMLLEMGEDGLRLGTVHQPLGDLLRSPVMEVLLASGVAEALPGCSDCALVPYCGADPVEHFARQGDPIGHRALSSFCTKNLGLLQHLFTQLRDGDDDDQRVFLSWLNRRAYSDVHLAGYRG